VADNEPDPREHRRFAEAFAATMHVDGRRGIVHAWRHRRARAGRTGGRAVSPWAVATYTPTVSGGHNLFNCHDDPGAAEYGTCVLR
jgi:hypothetical protein